ncbi:probable LRR receptor-like serine/threonine-protein kinase RPK1 [Salvia splendens]|uniref:probable LRR receptor-like serine/threonine-protein kinase RPK1 n=1 Tax=Salvia splendens TaxID=180675 RepID=UPI001C2809F7|nr:probable LRR receptor-like serine/threonine-protein kinase RPK1 [Salvia splendens]
MGKTMSMDVKHGEKRMVGEVREGLVNNQVDNSTGGSRDTSSKHKLDGIVALPILRGIAAVADMGMKVSLLSAAVDLLFLCILSSVYAQSSDERMALLGLKRSFSDPQGILDSWNAGSSDHCSWFGVSCSSDFRVTRLEIRGNIYSSHPCSIESESAMHGIRITRNCSGWSVASGTLGGRLSAVIGKLTKLRVLSLRYNGIGGEIPSEIWGLTNLQVLDLEGNDFLGRFSDFEFFALRDLRVLNLAYNRVFGRFPPSLSECRGLRILNIAGNGIMGVIPDFLMGFGKLRVINFSFNRLVGYIPSTLGYDCAYLEHLDLSHNFLKGKIPRALEKCSLLRTILLSSNALRGAIPNELGKLRNLEVLNVARNGLSGPLPANLGNCTRLSVLVLTGHFNALRVKSNPRGRVPYRSSDAALGHDNDYNSFKGTIPEDITTLPKLEILWAPGAGFEGHFPRNWSRCKSMMAVNLARNHLKGNDHRLRNFIVASVISGFVAVALILIALICYSRRKKKPVTTTAIEIPASTESEKVILFSDVGVDLTFDDIVEATDNFNIRKCIGSGGFGKTYHAQIASGRNVAVKRLTAERHRGAGQFHAEVSTLSQIRHPNLITLLGYYACAPEMMLIYNYLPGGNLDQFIRDRTRRAFDYAMLHKIALHIASALCYLHNQRILHRDIKPSNILLDGNCNAYLADFGLSKILEGAESHAMTRVAGTYGYISPEYALTGVVSDRADVFSYGVVLLELMSEKRVLDPSFYLHQNGFNIVSWACMLLEQGQVKEVFADGLWDAGPHDKLVKLLYVAVMCTVESVTERPAIRQVVDQLQQIEPCSD